MRLVEPVEFPVEFQTTIIVQVAALAAAARVSSESEE